MSKSDWKRGASESRQQIELLRARWPKAFPAKGHEVRPLANAAPAIAEALGWSNAYARGVLSPWVLREAYCRAVLAHAMRINLDGSESEQTVEDEARAMATARLALLADRKAQEPQRKAQEAERKARAAAAKPPPPAPLPARARACAAGRARARPGAAEGAEDPHARRVRKGGLAQARARDDGSRDHHSAPGAMRAPPTGLGASHSRERQAPPMALADVTPSAGRVRGRLPHFNACHVFVLFAKAPFVWTRKAHFVEAIMKVIVLASQKGGVGKTTLTGNLAVAAELAGDGPSVLIHTDPQGSLSAWWNARQAESPALAPATLAGLGTKLKGLEAAGYAYAVVDTPPAITDAIKAVVALADLVLIPVKPSPHDLRAVGRTVEIAREGGKDSASSSPRRKPMPF